MFRLGGIYLPRCVCRPYLARTFNEYYRRWLFYYSEVINHLLFNPLYRVLRPLGPRREMRFLLALFLAVFLGGGLFHILMIGDFFFFFGWQKTLVCIGGWVPYFVAIGLACCVSASGIIPKMLRFHLPQALNIALIFFINASLATFIQYYPDETWAARLEFWHSLFPF